MTAPYSVRMTSRARKKHLVDLSTLMALFESNYVRVMRLLPLLDETSAHVFHLPPLDQRHPASDIQIRVIERCRYTTLLRVTHHTALHPLLPDVVLTVKLSHDARVAEVIEAHPHRQVQACYAYPNTQMHQRNEKLQWNRFLEEWLAHCQRHGMSEKLDLFG